MGILIPHLEEDLLSDLGSSFWRMALILASTNILSARIAVGCFIVALLIVLIIAKNSSGGSPWWAYWTIAITNTIGLPMGIEAINYISYSAQFHWRTISYLGTFHSQTWTRVYCV